MLLVIIFGRFFIMVLSLSIGRNHISPHNNKAALSHETSPRKSLETPKAVRKIKSQNAITVSLPSPAGNRRSSRQGSTSSQGASGGNSKSSKGGKNWDKMNKVRKTVKQFSVDKNSPKENGSSSGGGGSSPQSQHPPLKQSASARQLGSTSSNGGLSPSQSIKKKKKKKKALPMSATVAVVAASGRSDSLKVTSSTPNLGKFGPTRASQ